jgi:hypothetical protein
MLMGNWKRRSLWLLTTLAVVLIAAAPALGAKSENAKQGEKNANYKKGYKNKKAKWVQNTAKITNTDTQESEEVNLGLTQDFSADASGDNSNVCQALQGVANTGDAGSNTLIIRVAGKDNTVNVDQDATGEIRVSAELEVECNQEITQISDGGSGTPPPAPAPPPPPKEEPPPPEEEETKIEAKR